VYDTLSGSEISKKVNEGDIQCILACAFFQEDRGINITLFNASDHVRHSYLEKAQDLIDKLGKHNLLIIYNEENADG